MTFLFLLNESEEMGTTVLPLPWKSNNCLPFPSKLKAPEQDTTVILFVILKSLGNIGETSPEDQAKAFYGIMQQITIAAEHTWSGEKLAGEDARCSGLVPAQE